MGRLGLLVLLLSQAGCAALLCATAAGMAGSQGNPAPQCQAGQEQVQAPQPTGAALATQVTPTCTSDYSCGPGQRCVKPQYSMAGTCVQKVNAFGTPDFSPPDPASVQVGGGPPQCQFSTNCPIGFRCDAGNCVRP